MYSYGEEFTYNIDGNLEYFTALSTVKIKENEYIIAEDGYGEKKVFRFDEDEEEIILIDDEDYELILEVYERQIHDEEPDFGEIDDEYEYEVRYIEGRNHDDDDEFEEFIEEDIENHDDFDDDDYDFDKED